MPKIKYLFADGTISDVDVDESFVAEYGELVRKETLVNRKETRRHQSLDKSLENGWDIADSSVDIGNMLENKEMQDAVYNALNLLTDKQRTILLRYIIDSQSFREIAENLGISKEMVRKYYLVAIKKMKKNLVL